MTTGHGKATHPAYGELEEFLKPLGHSQYRLAKEIYVPRRRINEIVLGKGAYSFIVARKFVVRHI